MDKLYIISKGMMKRFPEGFEPFQIMTRVLEECGEVANEVNHWENSGVKRQKKGEPSKENLAKEVMQALRALMQIVIYHGIESEFELAIKSAFERLKSEGHIEEEW